MHMHAVMCPSFLWLLEANELLEKFCCRVDRTSPSGFESTFKGS